MKCSFSFAHFLFATWLLSGALRGENIVYPPDAGIVDIRRDYGARGDGVTDDTAAIQKALSERKGILYFANGTYLVSQTLRWKLSGTGTTSRQILAGQSTAGTIIKLRDECPGFLDPSAPCEVIWTGKFPPQSFRNGLRNLTIDTGKRNPGAIGARFYANNVGGIRDIVVRSGDGAGVIGLDLGHAGDQGPMLLRKVQVVGFDTGIQTRAGSASVTAEFISLEGQKVVGWNNQGHPVSLRVFRSTNAVPAFKNTGGRLLTLLDAVLSGTGSAASVPAIVNDAGLFARQVKATGYSAAIGGKLAAPGNSVDEWTSHPPLSLFPSSNRALNLPVKETPDVPWDAPAQWVSVAKYPAGAPISARQNNKTVNFPDYTASFQQAIDSGASTVYFPYGTYVMNGTIHVRGKVSRIIGLESNFGNRAGNCEIVIEDGDAPIVRIEGFDWMYSNVKVRHVSRRTVVLSNLSGGQGYRAERGHGDLFLEDISCKDWVFEGGNVWARQLNPEGGYGNPPATPRGTFDPAYDMIYNDGASLWIWGLKTEGDGTPITAVNGARVEACGFIYANKNYRPEKQWVASTDSSLSISFCEQVIRNQPFDPVLETRLGETRLLRKGQVPGGGGGGLVVLFTGIPLSR